MSNISVARILSNEYLESHGRKLSTKLIKYNYFREWKTCDT